MARSNSAVAAAVVVASLAISPSALAARPGVTMSLTAPAATNVGGDVAVDVHLSGPGAGQVAGFQAAALVDADGGSVVTAIPALAGARILDPGATGGSATVGFFGGRPGSAPTDVVAHVLVTPTAAGRLQVRVSKPILVDSAGNVLPVTRGGDVVTIHVGSGRTVFRAPSAAPYRVPSQAARPGNKGTDVGAAVLDWQAAGSTVANVQRVANAAPSVTPGAQAPAVVQPTKTWVVNTTSDQPDARPGDGICATSLGTCSLRAAILEAERRPGDDEIDFNIPGRAPQTIQLTGVETSIDATNGSLKIDGYTQPGAAANTSPLTDNAIPGVVLRGYSTTDRLAVGLQITGGQNIIRGLGFESLGRAIHIYGPQTSQNQIIGNVFGITALGTRESYRSGYASVMVDGSAANVIGTPALADRNIITGGFDGIVIDNPGADGNTVQNNLIGVSPNGLQAWGGSCTGIDFNVGPKNNVVGGTADGQRNVIAAYGCDGLEFSHGWNQTTGDTSVTYQVNDNTAVGNYIGIRADGTYDPTFVAGGNRGANDGSAVNMWDIANHNTVQANYLVGALNAIRIAHNCNSNIVTGNTIGILPNGGAAPISQNGILVQAASSSEQIVGNRIGNTALAGIAIADTNDHFVRISQNMFSNIGTLGIDLAPLGAVNPNDVNDIDTGPNYRLNFPVITSARTTAVSGTSATRFGTVEVFTTSAAPGANGPGQTWVGTTTTSSTGAWTLPVSLPPGVVITTTITDPQGDTSEFGANVTVTS
jgi:CSLREA domain-containing protein